MFKLHIVLGGTYFLFSSFGQEDATLRLDVHPLYMHLNFVKFCLKLFYCEMDQDLDLNPHFDDIFCNCKYIFGYESQPISPLNNNTQVFMYF